MCLGREAQETAGRLVGFIVRQGHCHYHAFFASLHVRR
jgi:hypothetical protein